MIRIILGVIVGFLVWSILWVGSDQVLIATFGWYSDHQGAFQKAFSTGGDFDASVMILLMHLVRSVIISFVAGYLAALIAKENRRSPLILGILHFLFGLMVEVIAWHYLPVWYHLVFLVLLIPVTMAGGKAKKV